MRRHQGIRYLSRLFGREWVRRIATTITLLTVAGPQHEALAQHKHPPNVELHPSRKKVAILVFEGVELLDFAGPGEVFSAARDKNGQHLFEVFTVGLNTSTVVSQRFLTIKPDHTLETSPRPDIVVVPGGDVTPVLNSSAAQEWISKVVANAGVIFTVCNGATVLSKSGILDHRAATTHHGSIDLLKWLSPKTTVYADRRVVDNTNIVTAAGVSAGIDGALYLVARLVDIETARDTAVYMEYDAWQLLEPELLRLKGNTDPVKSIPGRVFTDRQDWAVFRLLRTLFAADAEAALAIYPDMRANTTGHDHEMITQAGLTETAEWLLENGRETAVGLKLFDFIVKAYPQSAAAWANLASAQEKTGNKKEAPLSFARSLELDPQNTLAQEGLKRLRPPTP